MPKPELVSKSAAAASGAGAAVKPNPTSKPSLTIKRRLKAPPAKVYGAWTEPEKIKHWWGPGESETLLAEVDLQVGGSFRVVFRMSDGEEHDVRGVYREIVPNEKLVFSWHWRTTPERVSQVTVSLKKDGDFTLLTLFHEQFFDEAARDGHQRGWSSTLDRLEKYIAS
jgi:uncharacterized protein YndB with AHSA1/START domain